MQAQPSSSLAAQSKLKSSAPLSTLAHTKPTNQRRRSNGVAGGIGLAHDAANLMVALGLYCDLLGRPGVLRAEHVHYAEELRKIATRSSELMRTLLDDTSYRHPATAVMTSSCDVAATLRSIAPLLSAVAAPHVTVIVRAPESVLADVPAEAVERILINLVRNASQAIENNPCVGREDSQAGKIRINLTSLAGHLQITVEDNGPGMHVTTAAAFLSPSPLEPGARHGLGHRIVHELVTGTGGSITVRVRPGRGTTFYLRWPAATGASFGVAPRTGDTE